VQQQIDWVQKEANTNYAKAVEFYEGTKKQVWNEVEPTLKDAQKSKDELYKEYNNIMDPKTREIRDFAVFVPTFSVGLLTFYFTRRTRPILRNTVVTYSLFSLMVCKENFNPLK